MITSSSYCSFRQHFRNMMSGFVLMHVLYFVLLDVVCFLKLGTVVLLCSVVGVWGVVIFVLSGMRVVGGAILWVKCVFVV